MQEIFIAKAQSGKETKNEKNAHQRANQESNFGKIIGPDSCY